MKSEVEDPRLLAVAWELGDVSTVDMMVKRLACECRADRNGNLIYRRSVCDSDEKDALKKYAFDIDNGDPEQNDGSAYGNEEISTSPSFRQKLWVSHGRFIVLC